MMSVTSKPLNFAPWSAFAVLVIYVAFLLVLGTDHVHAPRRVGIPICLVVGLSKWT